MCPQKPTFLPSEIQNLSHNERRVLQLLRRMGHGSKADLARETNLTNAAIGSMVSKLEILELVKSGKRKKEGQRGQPATMLHLNPTGAYGIGVQLERNSIQTVLIDFDGTILSKMSNEMVLPPPEEALRIVLNDIEAVLATLSSQAQAKLTGIGLAQPYNLGSWLKELSLPAETFKQWDDFDFAGELEKRVLIPVHHENDGTAATIAELFYGVGREIDDFLYIFFGPAIGGGLVLNGDIVRGVNGNAADVGLMPVLPSTLSSAPDPTGKWDILLDRASLNALRRHLTQSDNGENLDSKSRLELAIKKQNKELIEWIEDCVDALVPTIFAAKALTDFHSLIISSNVDGPLTDLLNHKLREQLLLNIPESRFPPEVINGTFGSDAGAVGAASIPIFYNFSPRNKTAQR